MFAGCEVGFCRLLHGNHCRLRQYLRRHKYCRSSDCHNFVGNFPTASLRLYVVTAIHVCSIRFERRQCLPWFQRNFQVCSHRLYCTITVRALKSKTYPAETRRNNNTAWYEVSSFNAIITRTKHYYAFISSEVELMNS
jgi:hypothetical protein